LQPLIAGLMQKIMPAAGVAPVRPVTSLGGIENENVSGSDEENDVINQALDRLEKHCDLAADLTALANMADNDPALFKILLMQLRK
jgi:hypothetical protein